MVKHVSPLRYSGGKTKLVPFVEDLLPLNNTTTFVEPFAGGAGVGLSLLLSNKIDKLVLNEYDEGVYAFWRAVLYQTDSLLKLIESTTITVDLFKESQALYKVALTSPTPPTVGLGFATFVLNRCSRSGILTAGPIGGRKQDGAYTLTARYNKDRLVQQIKAIASKKDQITLSGMSYREFLFSYFDLFNDPTTLVFLDPPYVVKGSACYPTSFALEEHEFLRNIVEATLTCPWFMTYDNVDLIKDLYTGYRQEEFSLRYSISQDRPLATERMIFSPNLTLKE